MRNAIFKKAMILCLLFIFMASTNLISQQNDSEKLTIAVMKFKNNSSEFKFDRWESAIPEMLKTELSRFPEILVVERSKIENILAEQALAQAGVIESETVQKVGRLAGAKYIITGEINSSNHKLRIDTHLIKVESGQILGEKISGKNEHSFEPMIKMLANNLYYDLTGEGERKEFSKISNYYSKWAFATTAAFTATSIILHYSYKSNYDKYHDTRDLAKFNTYYDSANNFYKARNAMLLATGTALITSLILWGNDIKDENKIYASNSRYLRNNIEPKWAMGLTKWEKEYLLSLSIKF